MAGAKTPTRIDGLSLVPSLTGKGAQKQHDYLYWEFHEQGGRQAIRQGNWKAVRLQAISDPNGPVELYDLAKDPAETHDIAAKNPDKVKQLSQFMSQSHVESALFPFVKNRQ